VLGVIEIPPLLGPAQGDGIKGDPGSTIRVLGFAQPFVGLESDDPGAGKKCQQTIKGLLIHGKSTHFEDREAEIVTRFPEDTRENFNCIHRSNQCAGL
jgi:hypothetical protein